MLAVFPEVTTATVAVEVCARVDADAMLATVGFFAVVDAVFTVITVETFWTGTGVICNQICARTIICTRIRFAVINVFLALKACESSWTDTKEAINLWSINKIDLNTSKRFVHCVPLFLNADCDILFGNENTH